MTELKQVDFRLLAAVVREHAGWLEDQIVLVENLLTPFFHKSSSSYAPSEILKQLLDGQKNPVTNVHLGEQPAQDFFRAASLFQELLEATDSIVEPGAAKGHPLQKTEQDGSGVVVKAQSTDKNAVVHGSIIDFYAAMSSLKSELERNRSRLKIYESMFNALTSKEELITEEVIATLTSVLQSEGKRIGVDDEKAEIEAKALRQRILDHFIEMRSKDSYEVAEFLRQWPRVLEWKIAYLSEKEKSAGSQEQRSIRRELRDLRTWQAEAGIVDSGVLMQPATTPSFSGNNKNKKHDDTTLSDPVFLLRAKIKDNVAVAQAIKALRQALDDAMPLNKKKNEVLASLEEAMSPLTRALDVVQPMLLNLSQDRWLSPLFPLMMTRRRIVYFETIWNEKQIETAKEVCTKLESLQIEELALARMKVKDENEKVDLSKRKKEVREATIQGQMELREHIEILQRDLPKLPILVEEIKTEHSKFLLIREEVLACLAYLRRDVNEMLKENPGASKVQNAWEWGGKYILKEAALDYEELLNALLRTVERRLSVSRSDANIHKNLLHTQGEIAETLRSVRELLANIESKKLEELYDALSPIHERWWEVLARRNKKKNIEQEHLSVEQARADLIPFVARADSVQRRLSEPKDVELRRSKILAETSKMRTQLNGLPTLSLKEVKQSLKPLYPLIEIRGGPVC